MKCEGTEMPICVVCGKAIENSENWILKDGYQIHKSCENQYSPNKSESYEERRYQQYQQKVPEELINEIKSIKRYVLHIRDLIILVIVFSILGAIFFSALL